MTAKTLEEVFSPLVNAIQSGEKRVRINGLWGSSKAFFLSLLGRFIDRPFFIITSDPEEAETLQRDLAFFNNLDLPFGSLPRNVREVVHFPMKESLSSETPSISTTIVWERVLTLGRLIEGESPIIASPLIAAAQRVPSRESFNDRILKINAGMQIGLDHLVEVLVKGNYHNVSLVSRMGEYSHRGGIVDIYLPSLADPVRVEFFGDTIESIRLFDPSSQRSITMIEEITILPAWDAPPPEESGRGGGVIIFDYLSPPYLFVLDEPSKIKGRASKKMEERMEKGQVLELCALPLEDKRGKGFIFSIKEAVTLGVRVGMLQGKEEGGFYSIVERFNELRREGRVLIVCHTEGQKARLQEIIEEYKRPLIEHLEPLSIIQGDISAGFSFPELRVTFITEEDIFGRKIRYRSSRRSKLRDILSSFEDLQVGDHVVHVQHGIGKYLGLRRLSIQGFESDFLMILYAGGDKLYVPLDRWKVIQKYVGVEGYTPKIDKLGGDSWERTKERAKKKIREIAKELLDLYTAREVLEGFTFSPDNPLVREFDASFEYEETPDQLAAIEDVKKDMERSKPMDRLVCGDVGYGKTEVAMRAAFKAVLDNKQVALVVPTTLLAQQHYQTFTSRFASFPVIIDVLSRFRTQAEQKRILKELEEGRIDIIIGTHRLLQKDVRFRDLGLVVIDEEQRFGVAHKERLKQLRKMVDVLTLTATPIPRTLQISISGIRNLSIIDTPPEDRLSVKTAIARFDKGLIREVVHRERERGGQVFFVHNRVQSIEKIAQFLKDLLPGVRIAVAHGQMRERDLEDVMEGFIDRKYDLLVTSAIIESGLDIPTANTIIINRADKFGLSDLYQLRGRVGRSIHQAYAYFLVPGEEFLTEEAKKRLKAIQELSELGSGFKLALRDLEMRGAGNLLGGEQSGHIAAVGFELYTQLLEKAVKELKGEAIKEEVEPTLNLRVSAYIPEEYIQDSLQRLAIYKRLSSLRGESNLQELSAELADRYGPVPQPVKNLLKVIDIRVLAKEIGISKIDMDGRSVYFTFDENTEVEGERIVALLKEKEGRLRLISPYVLEQILKKEDWEEVYEEIRELLSAFR